MKRYLTFVGDSYYADGGWLDFKGSRDAVDDASALAAAAIIADDLSLPWWHVVDSRTGEIVAGISGRFCGNLPKQS